VAEKTVKRLLCHGFRCTGKAMGQVYQCWWRVCREIIPPPKFEYHIFYIVYPFGAYLLTHSLVKKFCVLGLLLMNMGYHYVELH
jgi:hypothetical protein